LVYSVSISSDGSYIAAGSGDGKVYLFSRSSSTPLWSYQTGNVGCSVSISSDGSYIAAGSIDGKVYLFSRSSSTPLWSYQTGNWVLSVSISSDGSYIAAGSFDYQGLPLLQILQHPPLELPDR
jgi:WD40 repeat protein